MKHSEIYRIFEPDCELYHGSRGGLDGPVDPTRSRARCDFGRGFYLQTDMRQAKTWVITDPDPVLCAFAADLSPLADKTLVLSNREWIYTVLHNRRNCKAFNGSVLDRAMEGFLDGFDFVIGPIADDRLGEAISLFSENALTDTGLFECLTKVGYGVQIVAKTQAACDMLTLKFEQRIHGAEADYLDEYRRQRIQEGRKAYHEIQTRHKTDGLYLSELIERGAEGLQLEKATPDKRVLAFARSIDSLENTTQYG